MTEPTGDLSITTGEHFAVGKFDAIVLTPEDFEYYKALNDVLAQIDEHRRREEKRLGVRLKVRFEPFNESEPHMLNYVLTEDRDDRMRVSNPIIGHAGARALAGARACSAYRQHGRLQPGGV